MVDAERKLFDKMITHHIKSITELEESSRNDHKELYRAAKHVLWNFQEERKRNGKDT